MASAQPEPEQPERLELEPEGPEPDRSEDELKRKFREALEHKRAMETGASSERGGKDGGKVHGAHGPAGSRRSFRRRGGG
jgi:Family of unknown function (DUF5302)